MNRIAKKVRGSPSAKAEKIHEEIRNRIRYYTAGRYFPHLYKTAIETFRSKKGNCLDQAVLYTAIARKAGLRVDLIHEAGYMHAFPVVHTERGKLEYDPTSQVASRPYQRLVNHEEMTESQVKDIINKGRGIKIILRTAKGTLVSTTLYLTLNFTQPLWSPLIKQAPKVIEDFVTVLERSYRQIKESIEDLLN